jgi:hypothetical protein
MQLPFLDEAPLTTVPDVARAPKALDRMLACLEAWRPGDDAHTTWSQLDRLVAAVHAEARAGPEPRVALAVARARLHPLVLQAASIRRAYEKPRGYAGDSVVMDMGYRNLPEGSSPLGAMLHQWFCHTRGGTAVRARRRWILLQMQDHGRHYPERWRAMSLASGSAWELRDLVRESFLVRTAEVLCVDQDPEALADAEQGLHTTSATTGRTLPVRFEARSVRDILKGNWTPPPRDFIYSLGLYDYLDTPVARSLTEVLAGALEPGGRLIVGNYLPGCDARPMLELLMDWHLRYRSLAELARLGTGLGEVETVVDSTGTMGFLVVTRR